MLKVKRVYEDAESSDGTRFLVERLWPRGIKKEELKMEAWLKEVAPSDSLRRWFAHDPLKWKEFQKLAPPVWKKFVDANGEKAGYYMEKLKAAIAAAK